MKVTVLGGGVIGVSTAYFLMESGCEVTVVEQMDSSGLKTSFANGGQLAFSHATPWSRPELPMQLLSWIGKRDAPFRLVPQLDPEMWSWTISFLKNCTKKKFQYNSLQLQRLAMYSQVMLHHVQKAAELSFQHSSNGMLSVFRSQKNFDVAASIMEAQERGTTHKKILSGRECLKLEPALQESCSPIVGGIFSPVDECGDAYIFTSQLADYCARHGASFRYNERVESIEIRGNKAVSVITNKGKFTPDAVVICLGNESNHITRKIGIRVPSYPVKGYSVTLPIDGKNLAPSIGIADEENKVVVARLGNNLRAAGTAELGGYNTTMDKQRARSVLNPLIDLFPNVGNKRNASFWTGLRPMTPSGLPLITGTNLINVFLNTGHGSVGWTLACGSGRLLTDIVTGVRSEIDRTPLSLIPHH